MIVLEFGSHSLKLHYRSRTSGIFRKSRIAWDLGHEVYSTGRISDRTAQRALETIRGLRRQGIEPGSILAIATGALRDAENRKEFLALLENRLGLKVRVISGREEASLLANGYLSSCTALPALLADLGGGSLELVYLGKDRTILRDSLPLGTIRLHHLGLDARGVFRRDLVEDFIRDAFAEASVITADAIHVTGGTMKAAAKWLGRDELDAADLERLTDAVERDGPPSFLSEDRARVLLPGLIVLQELARHAGARRIRYLKVPIGRIFLQRHVQNLMGSMSSERRGDLLRDLRITRIYRHPTSTELLPEHGAPGDASARGDRPPENGRRGAETEDKRGTQP